MNKALIGAAVLAGLAYLVWPAGGFSDADITNMKDSIRKEYEKRGLKVGDVHMVRESKRKATGFVNLTSGEMSFAKHCTATMADDDRNYIWTCE